MVKAKILTNKCFTKLHHTTILINTCHSSRSTCLHNLCTGPDLCSRPPNSKSTNLCTAVAGDFAKAFVQFTTDWKTPSLSTVKQKSFPSLAEVLFLHLDHVKNQRRFARLLYNCCRLQQCSVDRSQHDVENKLVTRVQLSLSLSLWIRLDHWF